MNNKMDISDEAFGAVNDASKQGEPRQSASSPQYRLYKRRFFGLFGLSMLNIITAMSWAWFGPISTRTVQEFGITLNQVNWLGNIVGCLYLPTTLLIPYFYNRFGIRRCCDVGAVLLILASWVRFSGTAQGLGPRASYALLIFGQAFSAIAQPIFQVLGPAYSETWFDLRGRTTATMVIAISNPVGGAIGLLISPFFNTARQSIKILAIISTAAAPFVFLIGTAPPTPPTFAASKKPAPFTSLFRAMAGVEPPNSNTYMTKRERFDFAIVFINFAVIGGATNTFGILTSQIFTPYGYSEEVAGLLGATVLFAGVLTAIIMAPLFDRIFTHHLAITSKVLVPCIGIGWFGFIWAVKPHNSAVLFVLMAVIGACSLTMLPIALELACELTRNADGSSAVLWFIASLMGILFVLVEGALRAGPQAKPPLNMFRAIIFNGVFVLVPTLLIFFLKGKQARRAMDEQKLLKGTELRCIERTSKEGDSIEILAAHA